MGVSKGGRRVCVEESEARRLYLLVEEALDACGSGDAEDVLEEAVEIVRRWLRGGVHDAQL